MIHNTVRSILLISILLLFWQAAMPLHLFSQSGLQQQFLTPGEEAKPWTFWYWMYGAVSKEALTADLEAMKDVGLGGAYLMPIRSPEQWSEYPGAVNQLTPEWWRMIGHSISEADRLGLKLGMHICDGFALAGGPWITPEESMQKVVWTDTIVTGGSKCTLKPTRPEAHQGYYEDIALLAYPLSGNIHPEQERVNLPLITTSSLVDTTGGFFRASATDVTNPLSSDAWIQYEYKKPFTCRNVEIILAGNNYQAHRLNVLASDDGIHFRPVKQLVPARQGWQNTDANSTHALPPTTARYFRFCWNPAGSEPGSEDMDAAKWKPNLKIKALKLHTEPRLEQWEGKAGLVWRVAKRTTDLEIGVSDCIRKDNILDLTSYMRNGVLTVDLPKGNWKILRIGHTSTGHTNATAGGGKGLECDKFNAAAVKKQFDNWFGAVFRQTHPDIARRVLKYMHIDSWECGSQNWSRNFPAEFRRRRGYDLMPYLPLLAGIPIESAEKSESVLRDVRTTIAELVVDVFYDVMARCAKEYDCQLSAECVSPTMVSDGMMHYKKVDRPMGEFWLNSPTHDKPNDMLDAISGAHIYGKNIIQAEGFTQIRGTWDEHPGMIKALLDRNFALGINKLFFHVYVHNPYMDRKPGMTLDGIGLFFQRDQTWWSNGAKAFVDYVTRCQALLQYGHPVADIAVFTGEEIPRRAILPERLLPSLPGLYGAEKVADEKKRLKNEGLPLRTIVGVTHSANMADPEKWINPLRGYAYDSFNKDVLLNLAKVENGRMVLPGGASYKVVVLPLSHPMNPESEPLSEEVQAKISELRRGGVIVPNLPYTAQDFSEYRLERDVIVPDGVAWAHRCGEEADIYFISNQTGATLTFEASLRRRGSPQLWDPVTGKITFALDCMIDVDANRLHVPLTLAANGSLFIVLPNSGVSRINLSDPEELPGMAYPLKTSRWEITFPAINRTLSRDTLFDWSKEADTALKYYSGTALYRTAFRWNGKKESSVYLSLGQIAHVATVRLNGVTCGTLWTPPYCVEVTQVLKKGNNRLEIEVTNTWANAIRGMDKGTPPFEGIWTNGKYRLKDDILLPSGWLGPLEIIIPYSFL